MCLKPCQGTTDLPPGFSLFALTGFTHSFASPIFTIRLTIYGQHRLHPQSQDLELVTISRHWHPATPPWSHHIDHLHCQIRCKVAFSHSSPLHSYQIDLGTSFPVRDFVALPVYRNTHNNPNNHMSMTRIDGSTG